MKFYASLAVNNLKKNYHLYLPFIIINSFLFMISLVLLNLGGSTYFINDYNWRSPFDFYGIFSMSGIIMIIMTWIVAWYAHSFIIQQRGSQFGLYQVIGFSKFQLAKMLFCENFFCWILILFFGNLFGLFCSQLGYMVLVRLLNGKTQIFWHLRIVTFFVEAIAITMIFAFLEFYDLFWLWRHHPLKMIKMNGIDSKKPKNRWLLLILGTFCLAFAYFLALTSRQPILVWSNFLISIILVIIGTYLLYIAGSIFILKGLQKWRNYYYQPQHFIAIGNLLTRLKQNGAGLASIAILMTMALVTISSTTMLIFSYQQLIKIQIPTDIVYTNYNGGPSSISLVKKSAKRSGVKIIKDESLKSIETSFMKISQNQIVPLNLNLSSLWLLSSKDRVVNFKLAILPNNKLNLSSKDVIGYNLHNYQYSTIKIGNKKFNIKKRLKQFPLTLEKDWACRENEVYLFFKNKKVLLQAANELTPENNIKYSLPEYHYLTVKGSYRQQKKMKLLLKRESINFRLLISNLTLYPIICNLLIAGILLSLSFVIITLLILYFKQLSEGYADAKRYATLRRVGLANFEIKKTIKRQLLIMFYLPLFTATVHLFFAFPLINAFFKSFGVNKPQLLLVINLVVLGLFSLIYIAIDHLTSGVYYHIVIKYRRLNNSFFD
ncbi:MAG: hypothetical protein M3Z38_04120 [Bombilactobacillus mellifer]|nr:hypothetical protein [Bombilactobacillus mellifer]